MTELDSHSFDLKFSETFFRVTSVINQKGGGECYAKTWSVCYSAIFPSINLL